MPFARLLDELLYYGYSSVNSPALVLLGRSRGRDLLRLRHERVPVQKQRTFTSAIRKMVSFVRVGAIWAFLSSSDLSFFHVPSTDFWSPRK